MNQFRPHLTFHGRCREAMSFYQAAFKGGEISIKTFSDSPVEFPDYLHDRVMHAEMSAPELTLYASDGMENGMLKGSGDVALSVTFENQERLQDVFNALSDQGDIVMPLDDTFWQQRFGMVTDKFGIRWMLGAPSSSVE